MTEPCPCCNGTGVATAPPVPLEELRAWLLEHGHWVGPGDVTDTAGAAAVLGVAPQTLRTDRCYFERVPCYRIGRLVRYRLADLLIFVAAGAE